MAANSNAKSWLNRLRHGTMGQVVPPIQKPWSPPANVAPRGMTGMTGPPGPPLAPATQGGPTHANVRNSSDQRFRSFAERYVVARAHLLTADPMKLAEEQYEMVRDAKRLYAMIERAGQNIQPEDGVF